MEVGQCTLHKRFQSGQSGAVEKGTMTVTIGSAIYPNGVSAIRSDTGGRASANPGYRLPTLPSVAQATGGAPG